MLNNTYWKNLLKPLLVLGMIGSSAYTLTAQAAGGVTDCSTFGGSEGTLEVALAGGGLVTFECGNPGDTFTIIVPQILIDQDTTIDANERNITLSGNNANRVFQVRVSRLEVINLTITEGFSGTNASGGGIRNLGGTVILNGTAVSGNTSIQNGGGIESVGFSGSEATMSLTNSTVSGNSAGNSAGGIYNRGTMTLTNSTVSGNSAANSAGGIQNSFDEFGSGEGMTLINSTVSDNTAGKYAGGGIYNISSKLSLINSEVSGNSISSNSPCTINADGGGIRSFNGTMTLTNSTVSDNEALCNGGGIHIYGGSATITDSTISGNRAENIGGGISNTVNATLTITNSTLSGNSAGGIGGGIRNFTGTLTLTNSTLSGNSSDTRGGGIENYGALTLTNVTVASNTAVEGGGLFLVNSPQVRTELINTLIATNSSGGDCVVGGGGSVFTDSGYNLDSDGTCNLTESTSLSNIDPQLEMLGDNGGPTQTHALLAGSPAIDQIPPDSNGCGTTITTDQRGVARPQGSGCDIGAYETAAAGDFDSDGIRDEQDNCSEVPNGSVMPDAGGNSQLDTDADGYGNLCDGDLNNDGSTNTLDLNLYKLAHRTVPGDPNYNPDADFNGDGPINTLDLNIYRGLHRKPPGPSCCGLF